MNLDALESDEMAETVSKAICFGLGERLEPAVAEIHRANMSKLDDEGKPIINEAGRVVKSKNFVAANVAYLFKENVQ